MKGFTVICNSCGNTVNLDKEINKRHNLKEGLSVMIHSNVECLFRCWECEESALLNDKEQEEKSEGCK
ncbi:hypothetical protein [Bacillus sp. NEAU-Y102]